MSAKWTEMPSLYAIPRDTKGMPSNPAQAEAFLLRSSQVTAGSPRVRPAGDAGPVAPISGSGTTGPCLRRCVGIANAFDDKSRLNRCVRNGKPQKLSLTRLVLMPSK
jgi:hypothetical protein